MRIRAHHLLCMQGFQGYGYDRNFTAHIFEVIKNVKSCLDIKVEIIAECDVICFYCPNNKGKACQKELKIKKIDVYTLKKLDLREGTRGKVQDFLSLANARLRNISDVQDICGDCAWKEKCFWFISRDKQ